MVITVNMRTTFGLALLLTLILLANAVGTGGSRSGDDDGDDDNDDDDYPVQQPQNSAAMALTPTIFTATHDGVCWSALALTGVVLAIY